LAFNIAETTPVAVRANANHSRGGDCF